jgi:cytochrome c
MTRLRITIVGGVVLLSCSLLFARAHPFGDAGLYAAHPSSAPIMEHSNVPPKVRELLAAKCADCHSAQTRTPFYGRLAPISWLLERDILEGRKHMNLSAWDTFTPEQQQTLQAKILQQTKTGKMPLPQYRNIHRSSAITAADLELLAQWNKQTTTGETTFTPVSNSFASATQGKLVFEKRCTGCHSLDQNREGPRLGGVFGRNTAQIPGFPYSPALQNAHITWNELTLDRWLTDPDAYIPGNNMDFSVVKPQERRDLIQFLKESSAK